MTLVREIKVMDKNGNEISNINEMEIIRNDERSSNYIFVNQFLTNYIHLIDLRSGMCVKSWNMEELLMI